MGRASRNPGIGGAATIIDAHVHVCVVDTEHYPFTPLLGYTPKAAAPVEALIARMDACGVEAAVLVQPSYYGYDNRYLQESLARFPDRLRGVGLADPAAPRFPEGCAGVRLNAVGYPGTGWLTGSAVGGFWRQAEGAGLVVCAQCAPDQVAELVQVARAYHAVRCVVDHLGRGGWDDLIAAAAVPNVFVKVSGMGAVSAQPYPYRDVWPHVAAILQAFGPQRCLWGTDANGTDVAPYHAQVALWRDLLPLSPGEREAVMGGTAHQLFFGG